MENDKMILVIPPSIEGTSPYVMKVEDVIEKFNVSLAQLENAIDTGHVLKQHYFDEV